MSLTDSGPRSADDRRRGLDAWLPRVETAAERLRLLRVVLALAALCGFALSHRLWLSTGRSFPTVPAFDFLARVPAPFDLVWVVALAAMLAVAAASARPRRYLFASLGLAAGLALWDQMRWQPWFYQYVFMIFLVAAAPANAEGEEDALRACGLVVAGLYFWAGVHKLNPRFFAEVVPSLLNGVPAAWARAASPLALLVPLTEVCAGLFLLTRRWRRVGVALALAVHVGVLLLFFPTRRNKVVWPWNAAMAAFVLLLFRGGAGGLKGLLPRRALSPQTAALLFFWLLPLLSLFGLWERYLSGALYSGNLATAEVRLGVVVAERLPPQVKGKVRRDGAGGGALKLEHWSYTELHVPTYPSARVFRGAAARLCEFAESPSDVVLSISSPPPPFSAAADVTKLDCAALRRPEP
ncbi:MAG TPA: MauE/DoxX family redox-associated membrane protein [Pyrinomonadaceae bacterium]|nr:MauE/DoxX family redox-associated membrane protein [Pyrinomonadaceae bacterium]